ncbi:nicotinate phosphoribosyltransferase [Thalassoporum mexicanum PCC 7367]|uniref:nicotinate phosphoribosyltransferase n=1 Tax=Thalassoporum mexicanum TaxID=3457544 RepID=UPI00029F84A7|nr:nicotinate phosphoribosyltransferase [Pseudanabaena sp. PCC 7367]AFY70687.1 nicotinate phosphoribosyltransferase [Pseudanabaena sp. PCC 7367]
MKVDQQNSNLQALAIDPALIAKPNDYAMLTDLYQLTMSACYVGEEIDQSWASFELFVRRLPTGMGYLVAMGLAQVLDYLQNWRFDPGQIEALQQTGIFDQLEPKVSDRFWSLLAEAKFTGDLWAVPEGTVVFANEPILRIEAPLWQAQIAETYILNTINYQTMIATKAAQMRDLAGDDAKLLEFGTRRAFSPQASLWAARAAIAGGMDATSNVLAALKLGQKPSGTMAHALVMAIAALEGTEEMAFAAFDRYFPGSALLIDTFDTVEAAKHLAAKQVAGEIEVKAVRLDSGDLVALSQQVHEILPDTFIFASGDIDGAEIQRLNQASACIDGYGIGTKLVTGAPVNGVYKLVEIANKPVAKFSSGKQTYPGRKQVWRSSDRAGRIVGDRLALFTEPEPTNSTESTESTDHGEHYSTKPLLKLIMQAGKLLTPRQDLSTIAQFTRQSVMALPQAIRAVDKPQSLPIEVSPLLQTLTDQLAQAHAKHQSIT